MNPDVVVRVLFAPAVVAWLVAFAFMIRVTRHARRLSAPPWYINWNPLNLLVRPDLWTPEARRDCMTVLVSGGLFLLLGILGVFGGTAIALIQ